MNIQLQKLIIELKTKAIREDVKLWKRIATDLEKTSQNKRIVNLYKISKFAKDGETIIVPGKVLGTGKLEKPVTIAAFKFSESAIEAFDASKSKYMSISELMEQNPKGKKVRILG